MKKKTIKNNMGNLTDIFDTTQTEKQTVISKTKALCTDVEAFYQELEQIVPGITNELQVDLKAAITRLKVKIDNTDWTKFKK